MNSPSSLSADEVITRWPVVVAWVCLLFTVWVSGATPAAGQPTQPEATQFEPVDATDMVNTATGDLTYTIPLIEIPGPTQGYPLSLSYHGGTKPDQDATWVGLGWTLNPGAVNRSINGYPDDYKNGAVQERQLYTTTRRGFGVGIGIEEGLVGLGIRYDTMLGLSANARLGGWKASISESGSYSVGFDPLAAVSDESSVAGSTTLSVTNTGFRASGSMTYGGAGVGLSMGSDGGLQATLETANITAAVNGSGSTTSGVFGVPIPHAPFLNIGTSWITHRIDVNDTRDAYGYLYQDAYHNGGVEKKFERQNRGDFILATQDAYMATGQGMAGAFAPVADDPYFLADFESDEAKGELRRQFEDSPTYGVNASPTFRFLDDAGGNAIVEKGATNVNWGPEHDIIAALGQMRGGRRVESHVDGEGGITGFTITDTDGTVYEYRQPVYQRFYGTWTHNEGSALDDDYNEMLMASPYAVNWLLTEVHGPGYVDYDRSGIADDGDWGYWVRFEYQRHADDLWRFPKVGFRSGTEDSGAETLTFGIRENWLLDRIETASHLAEFDVSTAKDRRNVEFTTGEDRVRVSSLREGYRKDYIDGKGRFFFVGDWSSKLQQLKNTALNGGADPIVFRLQVVQVNDNSASALNRAFRASDLENITLVDDGKLTRFNLSNMRLTGAFILTRSSLLLTELLDFTGNPGQKLDAVRLFSKADPHVTRGGGTWSIGSQATAVKEVEFQYDYHLAAGTPGSVATAQQDGADGGRLTLNRVYMFGQNRAASLPPYQFEYADNAAPGVARNPEWNPSRWDRWGYATNFPYGAGDPRQNPIDPLGDIENTPANVWNLTAVTTPTGARIEVDYESDDYYYVGTDDIDLTHAVFKEMSSPDITTTQFTLPSDFPEALVRVGGPIYIVRKDGELLTIYDGLDKRTVTGYNASTRTVTLSSSVDFGSGSAFFVGTGRKRTEGGGIRVQRLTVRSDREAHITEYRYETEDGFSSGVTPTLPPVYSMYDRLPGILRSYDIDPSTLRADYEDYRQVYANNENVVNPPTPGVMYGRVEVANMQVINQAGDLGPLGGKTVYTQATVRTSVDPSRSDAYPYEYTQTNITSNDFSEYKRHDVFDCTSMFGALLRVEAHEQIGTSTQPTYRPVQIQEKKYDCEVTGAPFGAYDGISNQWLSASDLGVTHQRYGFYNKVKDHERGLVSHVRRHPFLRESSTRSIFYGSPTATTPTSQTVAHTTTHLGWDAGTGEPVITAQTSPETNQDLIVTKTEPAYWTYGPMRGRNVLNHTARSTTYRLDNTSPSQVTALRGEDVIEASMTTWSRVLDEATSDVDGDPYRKNDAYVYNPSIDREDGSIDIHSFSPAQEQADLPLKRATAASPWKMTNNTTQYHGPTGHVSETKKMDGTYSTTIHDPKDGLVTAVVENSRRSESYYINFETGAHLQFRDPDARTGAYSTRATYMDWGNKYTVYLDSTHLYRISYWSKRGTSSERPRVALKYDGTDHSFRKTLETNGEWEYLEDVFRPGRTGSFSLYVVSGGGNTGTGEYHLIDDIRIHPVYGRMKTYGYDPITKRLTSETDDNGITAFYEYDNAGRLIRKRDQDRRIVQSVEYASASIEMSPRRAWVGRTMTLDASKSSGQVAGYRWKINDQTLTGPEIQFQFPSDVVERVTLELLDTRGRVVARRERKIDVSRAPVNPPDDPVDSADGAIRWIEGSTFEVVNGFSTTDLWRNREIVIRERQRTKEYYLDPIDGRCLYDWSSWDDDDRYYNVADYNHDLERFRLFEQGPFFPPTQAEPSDDRECRDRGYEDVTQTEYIAILVSAVQPAFDASIITPSTPTVGETVPLSGSYSEGKIYRWKWTLPDGTVQTNGFPRTQYTYQTSGSKTLTLELLNEGMNVVASETMQVNVAGPPVADFTISEDPITVGNTFTVDASPSSGEFGYYRWRIDGESYSGQTVTTTVSSTPSTQIRLRLMGQNDSVLDELARTYDVVTTGDGVPAGRESAAVPRNQASVRLVSPSEFRVEDLADMQDVILYVTEVHRRYDLDFENRCQWTEDTDVTEIPAQVFSVDIDDQGVTAYEFDGEIYWDTTEPPRDQECEDRGYEDTRTYTYVLEAR